MFLIQDGHQTHTHIDAAIEGGSAEGVIWSPADETPNGLDDGVRACAIEGVVQAIDPQLYVAPLADANPKRLPDHALFDVPLRPRDLSARNLGPLTERLLDFQADRQVTHVLSPTVAVAAMADRWAEVAANLADTALAMWGEREDERPMLVSVAVQQSLLADPESVDALLDELTTYECDGFYLMMERDPDMDPAEGAVIFERMLYIIYALTQLNDYEVWSGYAGLGGFVLRAAGSQAFAGGWWQKQNWWSPGHWGAGAGGRQPRPRIFLDSVLGSLLIEGELSVIARQRRDVDLYAQLLDGVGELASEFRDGRAFDGDYSRAEMISQLLSVCSELDSRIVGNLDIDMRRVLDDIAAAEVLQRRIRDVGVELDPRGARNALTVWQTAVTALGDRLGRAF